MQNKITYLRIMPTQACNLSCAYCHREGTSKAASCLTPDLASKIIHACYLAGMKKFKFIGGEPTLYDPLPCLIKKMNWPGIDVSLISNGLFRRSLINECFEAGLARVNISIHAWDEGSGLQAAGMTVAQLGEFRKNMEFLIEHKKLTKLNYVFLRNADRTELFSIIDWISSRKLTLDILNVIYFGDESDLAREYCDFDEIEQLIRERYAVAHADIHANACSLPSYRLQLEKGGSINLKKFQLNSFLPFQSCSACQQRSLCREGILAVRLTPDCQLQPCLLRSDNRLDLLALAEYDSQELAARISAYLQAL